MFYKETKIRLIMTALAVSPLNNASSPVTSPIDEAGPQGRVVTVIESPSSSQESSTTRDARCPSENLPGLSEAERAFLQTLQDAVDAERQQQQLSEPVPREPAPAPRLQNRLFSCCSAPDQVVDPNALPAGVRPSQALAAEVIRERLEAAGLI
jgi:hypothetical protein